MLPNIDMYAAAVLVWLQQLPATLRQLMISVEHSSSPAVEETVTRVPAALYADKMQATSLRQAG